MNKIYRMLPFVTSVVIWWGVAAIFMETQARFSTWAIWGLGLFYNIFLAYQLDKYQNGDDDE